MSYKLEKLNYNYNSLEPFFDEETMIIHHTKHHQNYINNTNNIIKETDEKLFKIPTKILINKLNFFPKEKRKKLKNNLGGHINHKIWWKGLKKNTNINIDFKKIIEKEFFSVENFKNLFTQEAINKFGSGWIWLIKNKKNKLKITSTSNQDTPLTQDEYPIIGLDIWEHAYYLKFRNDKINYIKNFWNVINWEEAFNKFIKK